MTAQVFAAGSEGSLVALEPRVNGAFSIESFSGNLQSLTKVSLPVLAVSWTHRTLQSTELDAGGSPSA